MNNQLKAVCFSGALLALASTGSAQVATPSEITRIAADRALARAGQATHPGETGLGAQFDHADLVFEGVVRRVETRLSDPSADGKAPQLPVTYVTFDIVEVFWGAAPQRDAGRITIRLLGGPAADGRILNVSGRPLFGEGQRDILMVRRNHRGVASVLHGDNRRFRVRGGEVFYESGREILVAPDGELRPGQRHDIPEFKSVQIGGHTIEQVVREERAEPQPAVDQLRFAAEDFRLVLRRMAQRAPAAKIAATKVVCDVAMADRFVIQQDQRGPAVDATDATIPEEERKERAAEKAGK